MPIVAKFAALVMAACVAPVTVAAVVAVSALPVRAPTKSVEVTEV